MTIKDALYNNLRRLLVNISTDSQNIEAYSLALGNQEKADELTTIADRVEADLIHDFNASIEQNNIPNIAASHIDLIKEYKSKFSDFTDARFDEILFILCLIITLNNSLEEELNFEEDLDSSTYSLIDFDNDKFGTNVFHLADETSPINSFVFFNFALIEDILLYFQNPDITIPSNLIIQLISKIGNEYDELLPRFYTLIHHDTSQNKQKSRAYIALHLILNGKICHEPYEYTRVMSQDSLRQLSVSNNYHQFKDILTILSEYNSQSDILDKFLRLYHVIENFMFKSPLVHLERKQNGRPFSFRDFKRINNNISRSELDSLKKLIEKVSPNDQQGNITFKEYIFNKLVDIINTQALITEDNFNQLISYLGIVKNKDENLEYSDISADNINKKYAEILYAVRCSVVHNKESEFHLTHEILHSHNVIRDSTKVLLEKFLMPTMEEIIIFLITDHNNEIIWFSNSTLMLWEDTAI